MSLTREKIEYQVKGTRFEYDGRTQDLLGDAGAAAIPDLLLKEWIDQAVIDSNMELQEDADEKTTNCVVDSDEISPPSDFLVIKDVILYDDYDDSASPSGTSSYAKGTVLHKAATYSELMRKKGVTYDHGAVDATYDESGKPTTWMLWRRDNTDVIKFDREADHGYYVDVLYYTIPANLDTDSDQPEISTIFQHLIVDLVRMEVAKYLADDRSFARWQASHAQRLQRFRNIIAKRATPSLVSPNMIYHDYGYTG